MPRPSYLLFVFLLAGMIAGLTAAPFTSPTPQTRQIALGDISQEKPMFRVLLEPDQDFPPIIAPGPTDWLAMHEEPGQTFGQYISSGANWRNSQRNVIYILPLGKFSSANSPSLELLRDYAARFFQMEAKILPAYQPTEQEFSPRNNSFTNERQILATEILEFLPTRLPKDAYCLIAVTMDDLYPAPSWNFVFGMANLSTRVGVFSFARYAQGLDGADNTALQKQILHRACKVLVHETGHMCGILHCVYYECLLNGSNHLAEADKRPQQLCPVCLRKLKFCIGSGFDPVKRYKELAEFYRKQGWSEELAWTERQLAKAESLRKKIESKEQSSLPAKQ
ncbi:MAG: archaemetzincin [Puniceicoccales bacterium]|jgi:archaemetzincin|nr:archaemetzincin [Puniceicoccales bacterium]